MFWSLENIGARTSYEEIMQSDYKRHIQRDTHTM
jgi:hypothetical protein